MELEKGQSYRGPCGVLKDTAWLTAETLPADRDTVVTIEDVVMRRGVKFKSETKRVVGSLKFQGKDKELALNSTNMSILSKLYGADTSGWIGKPVALYVTEVSAFGGTVSAVRIRARIPKPAGKTAQADPEPGSDIETSEQRGG